MKRRLMIARALMHDPEVLILDEPSAGVDVEIRYAIWALLRELNQQGKTIILTTHYLEEAEKLCQNIAILDHGEIVRHSSMKQLLAELQHECILLHLQQPYTQAPTLSGFTCRLKTPNTLEVNLSIGQYISELFVELERQGIVVIRMNNQANRLETLFMNLVNEGKSDDK